MKPSSASTGFTLVELAIVLMIIGLLIGGILKGQELIENARIVKVVQMFKSYSAAEITFLDSYGSSPGDILNPSTRLSNCTTTPCSTAGNGNGVIGGFGSEQTTFWIHLVRANLITGIDEQAPYIFPKMPLGNNGLIINVAGRSGAMPYSIETADGIGAGVLSGSQAARIDRKMDDGNPSTGSVLGNDDGSGNASVGCVDVTGYIESGNDSNACTLLITQ
jgi:prepilin-type N-terminal cleavage/methylation domain-containing protein